MGFSWSRTKKKGRSIRESDKIRQQRHDYLYNIRENQSLPFDEQYRLVYLDESFLHHHHGAQFSWFSDDDFVERSTGSVRRWCFIHAVMNNGLLENAFLIFEGKKSLEIIINSLIIKFFKNGFKSNYYLIFPKNV